MLCNTFLIYFNQESTTNLYKINIVGISVTNLAYSNIFFWLLNNLMVTLKIKIKIKKSFHNVYEVYVA